jgi:hypothetical protein
VWMYSEASQQGQWVAWTHWRPEAAPVCYMRMESSHTSCHRRRNTPPLTKSLLS